MVCNGLEEIVSAGLLEYLANYINEDEKKEALINYFKEKMNAKTVSVYSLTENSVQMRVDEMIFTLRKTLKFGEEQQFNLSFETAIFDVKKDVFDAKCKEIEGHLKQFTKKNKVVTYVLDKKFKQKGFKKKKQFKDDGWNVKRWAMSKQLERKLLR